MIPPTRVDPVHHRPGSDFRRPASRRYLLAGIATVVAAGIAVGLLFAGVTIGHRYTTVHSSFTATTASTTITTTVTRTVTRRPKPKVITVPGPVQVITRTAQPAPGPTVTEPGPTVTVTETATQAPPSIGSP